MKYDKGYGDIMKNTKGYQGLIHRVRTKMFLDVVKPKKNEKILEIGCNDGSLLNVMNRYGSNCYGIDVNKDIINKSNNPNLKVMSATNLKFKDNSFDKIYTSHTLEHIKDVKKVFKEVNRVLKEGGEFIILFPYEPIRGIRAMKETIALSKTPFKMARELHIHRLTPRKIKKLIKYMPFKIKKSTIRFTILPDYLMILEVNKNE